MPSRPWIFALLLLLAPPAVAQEAAPLAEPPPALEDSPAAAPQDPDLEAAQRLAQLLQQSPPAYPVPSPYPAPAAHSSGSEATEIEAAVAHYRETGDASIVKRNDRAIHPYGQSQPELLCSPLRACDVELEAGETVTGVALGDTERWIAEPLTSGPPEAPIPHVILKPKEYDAVTNLVIGTTRRTYHLGLISPPKSHVEGGELAYHRHLAFYYPDDLVVEWEAAERQAARRVERSAAATVSPLGALSVDELNFAYTTKADKRVTWEPSVVFDDGAHTYLKLSTGRGAGDLPALLLESPTGELAIANTRTLDGWMIVDGLFPRARLQLGTGRKARKVEIRNDGFPSGEARP